MSTRGTVSPARSHTRTVQSSPPLTTVRPSALTATPEIDLASSLSAGDTTERNEARSLLETAAASAHPLQAPRAADLLGDLLAADGDFEAAREAYRKAVDSGDSYWAYVARIDLAEMLPERFGDEEGALELLRSATASENRLINGGAHLQLGAYAAEHEDWPEAERQFTAASGSGNAQLDVLAEFGLVVLTARRSAVTEAAGHADKMSTALTNWIGGAQAGVGGRHRKTSTWPPSTTSTTAQRRMRRSSCWRR